MLVRIYSFPIHLGSHGTSFAPSPSNKCFRMQWIRGGIFARLALILRKGHSTA